VSRRDQKPRTSQVRSTGRFDPCADAVTPRVLVAPAQTRTQSRHPAGPPRQMARFACETGAKGRRGGGERADLAKSVKPPRWGGVKNHVTPLQETKAT
jgi:hypothetical protein